MRWIEVCLDTPAPEIDARCEALAALGAEGFVIENEEDFRDFLNNNHQYWDYVDKELEDKYAGVSWMYSNSSSGVAAAMAWGVG